MRRTIRELNILFLCEDNASLSQMAEAVTKHLSPPKVKVFSAGVKASPIPLQVYNVMDELGVSLTGQSSKQISDIPLNEIDLVVSFGEADRKCGSLPPKIKVERWPSSKTDSLASNEPLTLTNYRRDRDEINKRVAALFMDYWRNVA